MSANQPLLPQWAVAVAGAQYAKSARGAITRQSWQPRRVRVPAGGTPPLQVRPYPERAAVCPTLPRDAPPLRATKRITWRIPLAHSLSVRLLSGRYGAEQSVRLAIYPVSEVKRVGIAIVAADSEIQGPQPARPARCHDRDCPMEVSVREGEGIDLASGEAEITDQQVIAESTKAGWRQRYSPRRCEMVARDQLFDEVSVLGENRDRSGTPLRIDLVHAPRRRVSDKNISADISDVERNQTLRQ